MLPSECLILSAFVHAQLLHLWSALNVDAVTCLSLQVGRGRVVHEAARRALGDERRERVAEAAAGLAAPLPFVPVDYAAMLPAYPVFAAPEPIVPAEGGPAAVNNDVVATFVGVLSNMSRHNEGDAMSKLWNNIKHLTDPTTRLKFFQTVKLTGVNPKDPVIVEAIHFISVPTRRSGFGCHLQLLTL